MEIKELRTEYLSNPIGIDVLRPRLSWLLSSQTRGARQSAYRIQVAHSPASLQSGKETIWDTGREESDSSIHNRYGGPSLRSRKRYYWRVKVWDERGTESEWSPAAFWETALLSPDEWVAKWIDPEGEVDPLAFKPCPYLRKVFELKTRPMSARAYVGAHGVYELSVNGQVIGECLLPPGFTSFHERLQYQTYDITEHLREGTNAIGVILGDGWYRGKTDALSLRNVYGDRLALLLQAHVQLADDTEQVLISDEDWKTATGPLLKSDLKDGEIYDARLEMDGWNTPHFDDRSWQKATVRDFGYGNLVATNGPQVKRQEQFTPRVLRTPNDEWVLDLGQNIAGRLRMNVSGPAGTVIKLQHGEGLDRDGNFSMANLWVSPFLQRLFHVDNVLQTDQYTLKGGGLEIYEPRFTFHGFRYVRVEGFPGEPKPENFAGVAIYSDMRRIGDFQCSNPLVNRLHENITWSLKSNFVDIPTDCPQRERSGWVGDAQVFSLTSSLIMETAAFYSKWLKDLTADQASDGRVPGVVPDPSRHTNAGIIGRTNGSAGFADAAVIIPWTVHQVYGDREILEEQYESMKAWVEYMRLHAEKNIHWTRKLQPRFWLGKPRHYHHVWDTDYHWGEWQEPDRNGVLQILLNFLFSQPEVATAYMAYSAGLLARIANTLGKRQAAEHFKSLSDSAREAWQKEFVGKNGRLRPDRQATYVRALAFDLLPEGLRPKAASRLAEIITKNGYHIGTGFLSTCFINYVLTRYGHADVAYRLLLQQTRPSWLYPVTKGATSTWEFWDVIKEDGTLKLGSMNHYSPGSIGSWLYEVVAGIRLDLNFPGFKQFTLQPVPGGGLTSARATHVCPYGQIECAWKIERGRMTISIEVPVNTRAKAILPGAQRSQLEESGKPIEEGAILGAVRQTDEGTEISLGSGRYEFAYPYSVRT